MAGMSRQTALTISTGHLEALTHNLPLAVLVAAWLWQAEVVDLLLLHDTHAAQQDKVRN